MSYDPNYLERACAGRGITRAPGESDDDLAQRAHLALIGGRSALQTVADYEGAAVCVPWVRRALVVRTCGRSGFVEIEIRGFLGLTPNRLVRRVQRELQERAPLNVEVEVRKLRREIRP